MKITYADVLLHLPVDATLRCFVQREQLALPSDFDWSDCTATSMRLIEAIKGCTDASVRDRIVAGLQICTRLGHPQGKQAMLQATVQNGAVMLELIALRSDLQRSFWLFVHHPELFERACEFEYVDSHVPQAQQHDLGTKVPVRRDEGSLASLREAIQLFYRSELGCGEVCIAHLIDRTQDVQLVTVNVKDLSTVQLEFEGHVLSRRVGTPNIPMALEYSQATGVARTIIRGGAKYHDMLVKAFSKHLLGVDVDAQRIKPPTLDLAALKLGFQVPQAVDDGFLALQVKSITVLSGDTALKAEFAAMASSDHRCVTELINEKLPQDNPLAKDWLVTAASINLYYPPPLGKQRCPVINVEVTRRGRLNLYKFNDKLRAQLEGYLISVGILQPRQGLSAHERETQRHQDELVEERST